MNVWPFRISAIKVDKIEIENAAGNKREEEQWKINLTPGIGYCVCDDKVIIKFASQAKGICGNTELRSCIEGIDDLAVGDSIEVTDFKIKDAEGKVVKDLASFNSEGAWDKNIAYGTTGLAFKTMPIDPDHPNKKFYVWDAKNNCALMTKGNGVIIQTQTEAVTLCVWTPGSDGKGEWASAFGGTVEEGLRADVNAQLQRKRFMEVPNQDIDDDSTDDSTDTDTDADDGSGDA